MESPNSITVEVVSEEHGVLTIGNIFLKDMKSERKNF